MMSTNATPDPLWRRAFSTFGRIMLTGIILGAAAVTIIGGRSVLAERSNAVLAPKAAASMPVAVRHIEMQDHYIVSRRFSGQFEARQETALSFELPGTIETILVREGDSVVEGQVIARLETRLLQAERERLMAVRDSMLAQTELARRTNLRQAELRTKGFATDQTVDDTSLSLVRMEAGIAEIDASLSSVDVRLSKAEVTAPFSGMIVSRHLDDGAVVTSGTPVASLIETAPPRFHVGLAPDAVANLATGENALIFTAGLEISAQLSALSPSLDPVTRSRMAWFDVEGDDRPADRSTGEIVLAQRVDQEGAWIPLSALRQGPRATWTLLTVQDGVVVLEGAEVLHLEADRAFVRGTFTNAAAYLPGGTHRVVPGQSVSASEDLAWVH